MIEIKLIDFAEAKYFAIRKPPQGGDMDSREFLYLMGNYENENEKETQEAVTSDDCLKTC